MRNGIHTPINSVWPRARGKVVTGLRFGIELEYENVFVDRLVVDPAVAIPPPIAHPANRLLRFDEVIAMQEAANGRQPAIICPTNKDVWWKFHHDGSLRNNGIEFTSSPLLFAEVGLALSTFKDAARRQDLEVNGRTGLHVHINMQPMTVGQVMSIASLYCLVEPMVLGLMDPEREDNNFCLPFYKNTRLIDELSDAITMLRDTTAVDHRGTEYFSRTISLHAQKYCGLNLKPLSNYGTIEFRARQNVVEIERIQEWVTFLRGLVQVARRFRDPLHLQEAIISKGKDRLFVMLGLPPSDRAPDNVKKELLEYAEDSSALMCGLLPVNKNDLNWNIT